MEVVLFVSSCCAIKFYRVTSKGSCMEDLLFYRVVNNFIGLFHKALARKLCCSVGFLL